MNVDLELYRVFCEVVKYKNISKAAESMYISQSAVTQSIQKLETILGGKVFYRNKTGVELTEEGKNLYEYQDLILIGIAMKILMKLLQKQWHLQRLSLTTLWNLQLQKQKLSRLLMRQSRNPKGMLWFLTNLLLGRNSYSRQQTLKLTKSSL